MSLTEKHIAEGHCVRALYIYSAMADISEKYNLEKYLEVCKDLFDDITNKKMYVTGGIGSTHIGEAFTIPYHLPSATAYTETCAAISLALFCKRMQNLDIDSKYADIAEKVIYNGFLSGISLDERSFFYENPLEIDPEAETIFTSTIKHDHTPICERVEVFECSCCLPNDLRFIASLVDLFYSYNNETVFVHQFAESNANVKKQ